MEYQSITFTDQFRPLLSNEERAKSLIAMEKQIQQILTTRNDLIRHKDDIGTDFKITTDFYDDIDYQTAYTMDDLYDALHDKTPASAQGQEYNQYTYKR